MASIDELLNLALQHYREGKLTEAEEIVWRVLQVAPGHSEAGHLLGLVAHQRGSHELAVQCMEQAVRLDAGRPDFHNNLGEVYRRLGKIERAIACFQRAVALAPGYPEAWHNLGLALAAQGRLEEAAGCYRRALELRPDYANAWNNFGALRLDQGRIDEAIGCFEHALALKPDFAAAHSNLLCAGQYRQDVTPSGLRLAHEEYDRRHAAPLRAAWRPHDNSPEADRPLRLGFVSRDLRRHPVGFFLVGALENLDRHTCEVACYSDWLAPDELTARLRAAATIWRDVFTMPDAQLAEQIRTDRIDILFDLAGHTTGNRLLVFARKPAPIQITWAGYVGTTGLEAMDYLLADRFEVPPEAEPYYRERVLRMPDGYVCYDPPAYAPVVGPLPARSTQSHPVRNGLPVCPAVTFGSLNHPAKIGAALVACWAAIFRRLPSSRLILKHRGLEEGGTRERLRSLFHREGVPADRLHLAGGAPHDEFLGWYNRIDIALDPFPYGGGLTTCEALWMGVPVVTYPGKTFAGRHSLSHLSNVGLAETIARDPGEYVEIAVSLAGDLPRLAALRADLRPRMAQSPLCDGKRFAANLTQVLRRVWEEWVQARRLTGHGEALRHH